MRKWTLLLLLLSISFVLSGCNLFENETVDVTSIVINGEKDFIEIGEELSLTATVNPSDALQDVTWSSNHPEIISVANGKIKGLTAGTADIVATSKENSSIEVRVTITVNPAFAYDDPTSVTFEENVTYVNLDSFITLSTKVLPVTASQEVTYTSSDEIIATVDSLGKVTGHSLGIVTITASANADNTLFDTFLLEVIDGDVSEIIIQGFEELIEGDSTVLNAEVLPLGVSQDVSWSTNNPELATINESGQLTALKEGTVYVTAISNVNPNIFKIKKVVVKTEEIRINPTFNLDGYEIEIMTAEHAIHEHDPFDDNYNGLDKDAKQQAMTEVQQLFNCSFKFIPFPVEAPWGDVRVNWLNENASRNAVETDIFVSTTDWVKQLADGGSIVDLTDYYYLYGNNAMSRALIETSTYENKIYSFLSHDVGRVYTDKGILYNVALTETLGLESPAKLFNDGQWTYTDFSNYVKNAKIKLNQSQTVLSGKPGLYFAGMVNAAGVNLLDRYSTDLNYQNQYAVESSSVLRDLYQTTGWGSNGWDCDIQSFALGNSIFAVGEVWFVNSSGRWPNHLWDPAGNSVYGFVPFPYPDDFEKEDTKTFVYGGSCYMQAANRQYPTNVTEEYIYLAFTEVMLRTGEIMRSDPNFDEEEIAKRSISSRFTDEESVNAVTYFGKDNLIFDDIYARSHMLGSAFDQIICDGEDYHQVLAQLQISLDNPIVQ